MLSVEIDADEARRIFTAHPDVHTVVLVDEDGRPLRTLERDRFFVAVTGPYGQLCTPRNRRIVWRKSRAW